ncbi:MAG TPA: methyltransferase domain-containing protein [Actinomycetota bacterium]|nr:methyltransferase domain-containing protein [Actinomycetota bacterium]
MPGSETAPERERDAFAEKLFRSVLGYFEIFSIHLGARLGLYRALAEAGSMTSQELGERAGVAERYAREWLEQQATAGILSAEIREDGANRFRLPAGHAEVLLDGDSLSFMGASVTQLMSLRGAFDQVVEAFRTGAGVPYDAYGVDSVEGQGGANRPTLLTTLPNEWLPAIPEVHTRLSSKPPARILDVGCGTGWSSIAMATAYPAVTVDGFDPDRTSVELARRNAEAASVSDRVHFHQEDAGALISDGPVAFATAFECIHDMARPVEVLRAVRTALDDEGTMLVVDERTKKTFSGEPDELEAYFYGWSLFDCLPSGMFEQPSAGTGTAMRPDTLKGYASEAGFEGFEVLPIEHDTFRLYLLRASS